MTEFAPTREEADPSLSSSPANSPHTAAFMSLDKGSNFFYYLVALNSKTALLIEDFARASKSPSPLEVETLTVKIEEIYLGWKAIVEGEDK